MIRPPRQTYYRTLVVDEESDLPDAPHLYEVARVESMTETGHGTHRWTGHAWVRWQFLDWERDRHAVFLSEEPLRWPAVTRCL